MKVKNIEIKKTGKEGYVVWFDLCLDTSFLEEDREYTRNWTTIYKKRKHYYFNNIVYRFDQEKKKVLDFFDGKEKLRKTVEPFLYYHSEKTEKVLTLLYRSKEVQSLLMHDDLRFQKGLLFHKKTIITREENLKKLILHALEGDYAIGLISKDAEFIVPLEDISIGSILKGEMPKGDYYKDMMFNVSSSPKGNASILREKEQLLFKLKEACDNEEMVKRMSFNYSFITSKGIRHDYFDYHFSFELPEETIWYDEIFYSDTIARLICQLWDEGRLEEYAENEEEIYFLADDLLIDEDNVFFDTCLDMEENKEMYEKQIHEDFQRFI